MAEIQIDRAKIPLRAYLRADPNTQHFFYQDTSEPLVTSDMFWGNDAQNGLYLNYSHIKGKSIEISEGITENAASQILCDEDCDRWIDETILSSNCSKLFVIQGYAGCGKTTFINHLQKMTDKISVDLIRIDIGYDWEFSAEPNIFFNECVGLLERELEELFKRRDKGKIWKLFLRLGSDDAVRALDISIKQIMGTFQLITKSRKHNWRDLKADVILNIRRYYDGSGVKTKWHNVGQSNAVIALLILLRCAEYEYSKEKHTRTSAYEIIFDNLDVISDPSIPAGFVLLMWGIVSRYIRFKRDYKKNRGSELPDVRILITVRKVLYSHIASHLMDLEMTTMNDPRNMTICDISRLYPSQEILTHRIDYWLNWGKGNITDENIAKLIQLKNISSISDETLAEETSADDFSPNNTLNLDAFVNYNFRAFSNVVSAILDNSKLDNIIKVTLDRKGAGNSWERAATMVFLLSLLYKKEKIWNALGFGCAGFSDIDYPTTLNRLILNYLYTAKRGQQLSQFACDRTDFPKRTNIQLQELIDIFKGVKFLKINREENQDQINEKYEHENVKMEDIIISRLADMCARRPNADSRASTGYESDDNELWRRPMYFTGGIKLNHTASTYEELSEAFKLKLNNGADKVLFSITDEGFTLINDFVANFEFYSARYGGEQIKPLCQATSKDEIDYIVTPVYNAIKKCCERNFVFMDKYLKSYELSTNEYLQKNFHPRTKPRYNNDNTPEKELDRTSFRPQLHIVRVIYSHIGYFNKVKEKVFKSDLTEKDKLCECLTKWIGCYLGLYSRYFFNILNNTICKADNSVYSTLLGLYKAQVNQYSVGGKRKNIDIQVKKKTNQKKSTPRRPPR